MAIYRPGPIIGAISGKLGGAVLVHAPGSPILRPAPPPRKSRSTYQLQQIARQNDAAHTWDELAADTQARWNTFAASRPTTNRLGIKRARSGRALFIHMWCLACFNGNGFTPTGALLSEMEPLTSVTAAFTQGGPYNITVLPFPTIYLLVQGTAVSRPMSATAPKYWRNWRWLHTSFSSHFAHDFQADIEAVVGELQTGEVVGVKCVRGRTIPHYPCPAVFTVATVA